MCNNKILSRLPYFHLLPMPVYKFVLKMFGEKRKKIEGLANIKRTGITIERFHRIIKRENYTIQKRQFYFINPNYEIKFGLKPRNQLKIISSFPWIRNFFTTAVYYLIRK